MNEPVLLGPDENAPLGVTDYYYRKYVPKDLAENLQFRRQILKLGYQSEKFANEIWLTCLRDPWFYLNVFGWTLDPIRFPNQPLRPLITYKYQDAALQLLIDSIGVEDIALPKTRDMGASWMCLLAMEWRWHFYPRQLFLLTSEKEELVDGHSEKALFSKLDFWWAHLPIWLMPRMERYRMHCKNVETGSSFDGEATVDNMGTGDRRTAIFLDETSKMPSADKIFTSTQAVTNCRIFNSTPNGKSGIGMAFYKQCLNPHTKRLFMHWSEHPIKNQGLYQLRTVPHSNPPITERVELDPETYDWRKDYDFQSMDFVNTPRSPWFDRECERCNYDEKKIAQELSIGFGGSSERWADKAEMVRIRDTECEDAHFTGRFQVDPETSTGLWVPQADGQFMLWCPLVRMKVEEDGRMVERYMVPDDDYVVGADVATGIGSETSSESSLVIWNRRTRTQVGLWASNSIRPEDFARLAVAICRWLGNAYLVPESNGPGGAFLKEVKQIRYYNLYRRYVKEVVGRQLTPKLGYYNDDGGLIILGELCKAMSDGLAHVKSRKIIGQLLEYQYKGEKLQHAGAQTAESEAARGKSHGDCAIATACGWWGIRERPLAVKEEPKKPKKERPLSSMGQRREAMAASQGGSRTEFDF